MHLIEGFASPEDWIRQLEARHCRAAFCPVKNDTEISLRREYKTAARENDIVLAEVHAWSNISSADETVRSESIEFCIRQLQLAEELEANCCVTTAGSYNKIRGPHKENLSHRTFNLIVDTVQKIIDAVQPEKTFTLECMPWIYPDTPESYLELIKAVDREKFAVHFDPVNMINTLDLFHNNTSFLMNSISLLGLHIKSCHGKDIILGDAFPIEIKETAPGKGELDYRTFLGEMNAIDRNMPLMLEHLKTDREYLEAAEFLTASFNNELL